VIVRIPTMQKSAVRPPTERFALWIAATMTMPGSRLNERAAVHAPTKKESTSRLRNSAARVSRARRAAKYATCGQTIPVATIPMSTGRGGRPLKWKRGISPTTNIAIARTR
jgi:hypothetical protein